MTDSEESPCMLDEYEQAVLNLGTKPATKLTVQDIVDYMAEQGIHPDHYKCINEDCAQEFLPEEEYKLCPTCVSKLRPIFSKYE